MGLMRLHNGGGSCYCKRKRLRNKWGGCCCYEGAMDSKLLEALFWKGVPVFYMGSNVSTIDVGWGSPKFHQMGWEKVILVNTFLSFGYELLICDTDMIFFQVCSI
jgi:hypothetical protein